MLDIEAIKSIIPHRYPFLLLDRVETMEPGKHCVAVKNVSAGEFYFQGHFPDEAVMPGVLIIEALAQAGAVTLLSLPQYKGKTAYFGGIKNARFKRKVKPGDCLRLEIEITGLRMGMGMGLGTAYIGEEVAASGELLFAIG